jgi:hypothetical protein
LKPNNVETKLETAVSANKAAEAERNQAQQALNSANEYLAKLEGERAVLKARSDEETSQHGLKLVDAFRTGRTAEMDESQTATELLAVDRKHRAAMQAKDQLETELTEATDRAKAAGIRMREAVAAVLRVESVSIAKQLTEANQAAEKLRFHLRGLEACRVSFDGSLTFLSAEAYEAMKPRPMDHPLNHQPLVEHVEQWRARIERLTNGQNT